MWVGSMVSAYAILTRLRNLEIVKNSKKCVSCFKKSHSISKIEVFIMLMMYQVKICLWLRGGCNLGMVYYLFQCEFAIRKVHSCCFNDLYNELVIASS